MLVQHRDPIAFLEMVGRVPIWVILWPWRLGVWLLCLLLFLIIFFAADASLRPQMILGALLPVVLFWLLLGLVTIPTGNYAPIGHWLRFWSLYLTSAPVLFVLTLCGVSPLWPAALVLGQLVGLPILLGFFVTDALTLFVHLVAHREARQHMRYHQGGPAATYPSLRWWRWVRWARLGMALLALTAAVWLGGASAQIDLAVAIFLCVGAAAFLRLEATALALMKAPLAWCEMQTARWRATYVGRNLLFLPSHLFLREFRRYSTPQEKSEALLVLLHGSAATPHLRRAIAYLPPSELHALMLHVSLESGGAEVLNYVHASLSSNLAASAERYASFAIEAAKPLAFQQWLRLLPKVQPRRSLDYIRSDAALTAYDPAIIGQLLADVRTALAHYRDSPVVDSAAISLRQFVTQLGRDPDSVTTSEHTFTWPEALLIHLSHHQRRLRLSTYEQ
jgi:hypothetical protein